jgi:hypothetical protein
MSAENNIPKVTVGRFVHEMSQLYTTVLKSGWSLHMVPAPFVWGPPGVGKSEGVYQIAANIKNSTGKNVEVTDIRLSMFSPIDLRGVPVADAKKEFTVWLKPKIFALDDSEEMINILFFDELSSAPQQVQAAAYQITLDHRIGEHKLPDNCIIIGAGNRTIDKSVVFRMPNALANRLQHYEILTDYDSWRSWATQNSVHPYVLGYLAFDNSKLCQEEVPAEQIAFPSPRTWVFVSNLLRIFEGVKPVEDLYTQISACVGVDTALAFLAWVKKHRNLPDVADVFRGKYAKYPASSDALFALVESMITYIKNREGKGDTISQAELNNMAMYVSRFPMDYQASLYFSLEQDEKLMENLKKVKLYREYKRRNEGII